MSLLGGADFLQAAYISAMYILQEWIQIRKKTMTDRGKSKFQPVNIIGGLSPISYMIVSATYTPMFQTHTQRASYTA